MFVRHLKGGQIDSLAFGPDGTFVVPRQLEGVLVWPDFTAGTPPRALPYQFIAADGSRQFDNPHGRVRLSADGQRIGCRGWFRPVVYDLGGALPVPFEAEVMNPIDCAALTPDGDAVVFSQARPRFDPTPEAHTRLSLRPVADPRLAADRWTLELPRWVWDEAAFLPGGRFVSPEGIVPPDGGGPAVARWYVRDLATGRELAYSPPLGRLPMQATAPPDGQWVAGIHTKHLLAWQPDAPDAPLVERKNDGRLHFTGLAFHPSGGYLATTSSDATVRVYDTARWEVVRTYAWQIGKLRCVAFSADGLLAAAGSDSGNIVVWDVDL